jgi:hypothetical protein
VEYGAAQKQPPSGAMTMDRALEIAKCYACLGLDALTNLKPSDLAAEFVRIDRAARRETLKALDFWNKDFPGLCLGNFKSDLLAVELERRLEEIKHEN